MAGSKIHYVNLGDDVRVLRSWSTSVRVSIRSAANRIASNKSLRRLAEMPLTVAGAGCFSASAFIGNVIAGFAVAGFCLIALELMISDPEPSDGRGDYLP